MKYGTTLADEATENFNAKVAREKYTKKRNDILIIIGMVSFVIGLLSLAWI